MKKYIVLSLLLLIVPIFVFGREKSKMDDVPKPPPVWEKEFNKATSSNYVETFAEAFVDPNVLIGVFEVPKPLPNSVPSTTLSSGEILEELPGYWSAMSMFGVVQLQCVKSVKFKFIEPIVFLIRPPIMLTLYDTRIPPFIPFSGTKWILALQKTNPEYRIARLGKDVEKYKFFNDQTVFSLFHWGHGALCLKWPEKEKEPMYMVKVSESVVDDFEAIQRVVPYIRKEKIDPNELEAINKTSKALKTDVTKSIFEKVLAERSQKTQDPNDR